MSSCDTYADCCEPTRGLISIMSCVLATTQGGATAAYSLSRVSITKVEWEVDPEDLWCHQHARVTQLSGVTPRVPPLPRLTSQNSGYSASSNDDGEV